MTAERATAARAAGGMVTPAPTIRIVDGLDAVDGLPEGGFGIVLKIHHAAIDGMAGMQMITAMHDDDPDGVRVPLEDHWRPEPGPSATTLLAWAGVHAVTRPLNAARL